MRKSGVLLPVSAIPSRYGIGAFSREAFEFVDFLEKAGQKIWQILPLGPTGYGDSPYQSFSTFAGNPYYIDLVQLTEEGYLSEDECEACDWGSNREYTDYGKLYLSRSGILEKAYKRAVSEHKLEEDKKYRKFIKENGYWLEDYAKYMAVKDSFGGICWIEWEEDIRLRRPKTLQECDRELAWEIGFYKFQQFLFAKQWRKLKKYANKKGIEIVGDIPIYVALDSADTWANPELFKLDLNCIPTAVAGCPPDAFSSTGQLWGNPLYDWKYHKKTGYEWWMRRIAYCYELYDIVRIDHFRGFDAYWSIPYGDATAENGRWVKGPGYDIFRTMKKTLGEKKVIAEDLGFLTDSVIKLVKRTGYPGMKILQFAFDSREESDYLPHNYGRNCVVYTGTHDNDTTLGWYHTLDKTDKALADRYLNIRSGKDVPWEFIRSALASVADTAVIPMQDYLTLDSAARINTPSTLGNNWKWRMKEGDYEDTLAARIRQITKLYSRL